MTRLFRTKTRDTRLHGIQIMPAVLAEQTQPHVEGRCPHPPPPVVVGDRQCRKPPAGQQPLDVRAPVTENTETPQAHQPLRRFQGFGRLRQNAGNLKRIRGRRPQIIAALFVEQHDDAKLKRVGDEPQAVLVESVTGFVAGTEAEGFPQPLPAGLYRRSLNRLGTERVDDPVAGRHEPSSCTRAGHAAI